MSAARGPWRESHEIFARVATHATLAAILLVIGSHRGAAQTPASDTVAVPRALVNAWLGSSFGFGTKVHVAAIPETLRDRFIVPPRSRVVGSIESYGFSMAVLEVPLGLDSVRAYMRRELAKLGWSPARPRTEGGFRSDEALEKAWCRGTSQTAYTVQSRGARQALLALTAYEQAYAGDCANQGSRRPDNESGVPLLLDPEGSFPANGDACREDLQVALSASSTTLETTTPSDSLLDYYGRQLRDSGWTAPLPPVQQAPLASRSWAKRLPDGKIRVATIHVMTPGAKPKCKFLSLTVQTKPAP